MTEEDRNARIAYRLSRARSALDRTLDELRTVQRRIDRHRARISRLERALATPAEERSAIGRKAVDTKRRRAVPEHLRRGLRVED